MSTFPEITARAWNECRLLDAVLELTHRCNFDCFFCYNDVQQKGTPLSFEQYETFLDIWKDADEGLASVEDARLRLARLKSEG